MAIVPKTIAQNVRIGSMNCFFRLGILSTLKDAWNHCTTIGAGRALSLRSLRSLRLKPPTLQNSNTPRSGSNQTTPKEARQDAAPPMDAQIFAPCSDEPPWCQTPGAQEVAGVRAGFRQDLQDLQDWTRGQRKGRTLIVIVVLFLIILVRHAQGKNLFAEYFVPVPCFHQPSWKALSLMLKADI